MSFEEVEEGRLDWLVTSSSGLDKVKLFRMFFGNLEQLGIGGMISDYLGAILSAYSKLVGARFAIEAKILALLEGLLLAKTLCLSNLTIKGDSAFDNWIAKS